MGAAAANRGCDPVDLLLDLAIADDLQTLVLVAVANRNRSGADRLITDDHTLLALGDAGAHVMSVTNYRQTTHVLSELVRNSGTLSIEEAVRLMTSRPSDLLGLGRGRLQVGAPADVCVVDPATLAVGEARVVRDLPGGAPRLYQGASGYRAVIINGVLTIDDDRPTGAAAGVVLRG